MATCRKGSLGIATRCRTRNSQKQPHGETGSQVLSSTKMWQRCRWKGVCQGRSGDRPPQYPIPVHGQCAGILSPPLSCGEGTGLGPESAGAPEQKEKPYLRQEMVLGIECHARPHTLLQRGVCVCLVRPSKVNAGRELGARELKAQDETALPRLFFPAAKSEGPKPC